MLMPEAASVKVLPEPTVSGPAVLLSNRSPSKEVAPPSVMPDKLPDVGVLPNSPITLAVGATV